MEGSQIGLRNHGLYTSVSIFNNSQNVLTIPLFFISLSLSLSLHLSILHSRNYIINIIFIKHILHVQDTCRINLLLHFFDYVCVCVCLFYVGCIYITAYALFVFVVPLMSICTLMHQPVYAFL